MSQTTPLSGKVELPPPKPPGDAAPTDVVIYDGLCGICRAQIGRLARWDRGKRMRYLSLHDPQVRSRWPDLDGERLLNEMAIVDRFGNRYWGADAVRYLSRRLPRLWPLAPLLHIPGSMRLWRPLYAWVARNRYRLSGAPVCDGDTCSRHFD